VVVVVAPWNVSRHCQTPFVVVADIIIFSWTDVVDPD
jgi:hypothetical protein